jgi:hypothetical protein
MDFSKFKLAESDEKLLNNLKNLNSKGVLSNDEYKKKEETLYKKYVDLQEEANMNDTDKKLLENLKNFHSKGVLSKDEFEKKKNELLSKYKNKKGEETTTTTQPTKRRTRTLLRPNLNDKEQKILESLEGLLEKKTLSETEFNKKKEDLYNKAKERIEKEKKEEEEKEQQKQLENSNKSGGGETVVEEKKKVVVKKKFSELTEEEKKKVLEKRDKTQQKHLTDQVKVEPPKIEKLDFGKLRKDLAYTIARVKENHPELKELDFTDISFNDQQAKDLFVGLEKNTVVTRVLMTNTNLNDTCVNAIANVVKNNKTITM